MSDEPPARWAPRDPAAASASPGDDEPAHRERSGTAPGKKRRTKRPKRTGWRRALPDLADGARRRSCVVVLLLVGGFVAGYQLVDIPRRQRRRRPRRPTSTSTPTAPSSPATARSTARTSRSPRSPRTVQHAVLAAEDRDFYSESAVDPKAMVRAGWNTVTGKGKQSGSTITQQYVKNYYLGQEQTVTRKVKEFFIAIKLDREETKDEILEGYLNTSYFGRNAYGIQAAAQAYYGKDVERAHHRPGRLPRRPAQRPQRVRRRRPPREQGRGPGPLELRPRRHGQGGLARPRRTRDDLKFPVPERGQAPPPACPASAATSSRPSRSTSPSNKIIDEKTLRRRRLPHHHHPRQARSRTPSSRPSTTSVMDKLDKKDRKVDTLRPRRRRLHRPGDRQGRRDVRRHRLHQAVRQQRHPPRLPGRLHLQAVRLHLRRRRTTPPPRTAARITPNTVYDGTNKRPVAGLAAAPPVRPRERGRRRLRPHHRPHRHRQVRQLGLRADGRGRRPRQGQADRRSTSASPRTPPTCTASPSIALGPATASVLDMAEAYATLANHGRHGPYTLVEKITKDGARRSSCPTGRPSRPSAARPPTPPPPSCRASSTGGTGTAAQAAGRPAAGKTGTAEEDKAAWFAGLHPRPRHRRRRDGPGPRHRRPEARCTGPWAWPAINGGGAPAEIWAAVHRGRPAGHPPPRSSTSGLPARRRRAAAARRRAGTDTSDGPDTPDDTDSSEHRPPSDPGRPPATPAAPTTAAPPGRRRRRTGHHRRRPTAATDGGERPATTGDGGPAPATGTDGGTDGDDGDSGRRYGEPRRRPIEGVRGARDRRD